MKFLSVVGARPQFIKLHAIQKSCKKLGVEHIIVHTGQHYDYAMSEAFFEGLDIPPPDVNLEVGSGTHASQTGQLLVPLSDTYSRFNPDWVLLYGDTNSTLAASITASKDQLKTAHVEAGLRSFDKSMPEEINRICTDHLAEINFAPTESAMQNLEKEGLSERSYLVGDVMKDALLSTEVAANTHQKNHLVLTLHRPSNVDNEIRIKYIFEKLKSINNPIVLPIHPRLRDQIKKFSDLTIPNNVQLTDPLSYVEMIQLVKSSIGILTDSGGLQKEAYMLGKLCLTVRTSTEWTETLVAARNILDPNLENLETFVDRCNSAQKDGDFIDENTYGAGNASDLILSRLLETSSE